MGNRTQRAASSAVPWYGRRWPRRLVSLWLAFHLLAVVLPPLSVDPGGNSPLIGSAMQAVAWYVGPLNLNHGYRFFGPDPPLVSYLIHYEAELPDGAVIEDTLPDHRKFWPRLFYHRHLMLTSRLQAADLPPEHPLQQMLARPYAESYARHLAWRHQARVVRLYLVQHRAPGVEEVRRGMRLTDPQLYRRRLIYTLEVASPAKP